MHQYHNIISHIFQLCPYEISPVKSQIWIILWLNPQLNHLDRGYPQFFGPAMALQTLQTLASETAQTACASAMTRRNWAPPLTCSGLGMGMMSMSNNMEIHKLHLYI